jgi:23S rRNA (uridine2552-2'-O)-methyltransferase
VSAGGGGGGNVPGRESGRSLKTRVKTARKRSLSSTLWLQRQLNDPYVAQAKRDGYRSRAAYKIIEMDERFHLFRPGGRIVDLGAAPGGWSQVAAAHVKAKDGRGGVVAVDLLDMEAIPGVAFAVKDFNDPDAPGFIKAMLGGAADGVMSDMAANATGHRQTDHLRIVALAELAAEFAMEILAPGGFFVAKVLQGGTEGQLLARLKSDFATVRHVKPAASRADSAELYVLASGFRRPRA